MASFFSITEKPSPKQYGQGLLSDPVHRSESESGACLTRTRSTAVPRTRDIFYTAVSESSKQTIEDWEENTIGYGGESFNWTDPNRNDRRQYVAKLAGPISYQLHPQNPSRWQVKFTLILLAESSSSSSLSSSSLSSSSSSFSSSSSSSSLSSSSSFSSSSAGA